MSKGFRQTSHDPRFKERSERGRLLPAARSPSEVFKLRRDGFTAFVTVEYFSDGRPAALFFDMGRVGHDTRDLMNAFAQMASLAHTGTFPMLMREALIAATTDKPGGEEAK